MISYMGLKPHYCSHFCLSSLLFLHRGGVSHHIDEFERGTRFSYPVPFILSLRYMLAWEDTCISLLLAMHRVQTNLAPFYQGESGNEKCIEFRKLSILWEYIKFRKPSIARSYRSLVLLEEHLCSCWSRMMNS